MERISSLGDRLGRRFLVLAAIGVAMTVGLSACAPTAAPSTAPTPPAVSPAVSPVPSSAARPAPTPGGVPPTVVGRAVPAPSVAPAAVASPSVAPAAARVTITTAPSFDPPMLAISRGQSVQWINSGRSPQTATDNPALVSNPNNAALPTGAQPWDSGVLNSGQTFTYVFNTPGDYTYTSLPAELRGLIGHITVSG